MRVWLPGVPPELAGKRLMRAVYGPSGRALVVERHDGDTIRLVLTPDEDSYCAYTPWLRLEGCDAPEEGEYGYLASERYLFKLITCADSVEVVLTGWSFARQVARIWVDGQDVARLMVDAGHAQKV